MRLTALVVAAGLVVSGAVISQPAQATPQGATCSLKIPAKLVIDRPDAKVEIDFGSDCPSNTQRANWTSTPGYVTVLLEKNAIPRVPLDYLVAGAPTTWVGGAQGAQARGGKKVADLVPAHTVMKAASIARLSAVRRGTKVTLTASSTYFSIKARGFVRNHSRMLLEFKNPGSSWQSLGYVTPNSSGVATYAISTNRARDYRIYLPSNNTVWYSYSPAVHS
jgi:hypothetical protein